MSDYPRQPVYDPNLQPQGGQMGYPPQGQMSGYPPTGQPGFAFQGQMSYPPQNQMGFASPAPMGYPAQQSMGYPNQQPIGSMPQGGQMGYPPQGQMSGYSSQIQMGNQNYPQQGQMSYGQMGGQMGNINPYYIGRPTVMPSQTFNADADSQVLYKAMKGFGTDEAAIIGILTRRTFRQRQEIVSKYISLYGKDLVKHLKSEISGRFETVVLLSLRGLPSLLANSMYAAVNGAGTDEILLLQCIIPYPNAVLSEAVKIYNTLTGKKLENDIRGDTSSDFQKILIALMQGRRDETTNVDINMVRSDAERLYKAGEGRMGTEEAVFTQIFAQRSFAHIKALSQAYAQQHGTPLIKAIKKETSRDYEDALVSIVKFAEDKNGLLAEWFYKSMSGSGTRDDSLILMTLGRSEIDLADVKAAYQQKYGKSLARAIESDTSGDYRKMLLGIVGA